MKAIESAMGTAFLKAVMMLYPKGKRLFEDPYAERLLSLPYRFTLNIMRSPRRFDSLMKMREKMTPGLVGWMFCRVRYIDDLIKSCIAEKKITTIVNLGAGMDCRGLYIPGMERLRYFEVDHPSVINKKRGKIKKMLGSLPDHIVFTPIDFTVQGLDTELGKAGYDPGEKTLFIMEGVTQYITEKANDATFTYAAKASSGSRIVFTYVLKDFIEGGRIPEALNTMYTQMRKKRDPLWIYGLDPVTLRDDISRYSLSLVEDIGSNELRERYMKPAGLDLGVLSIERIALAEVR
ncbi:MAG: SAM-dependent methyltransferase [Spirochaetales bacterium]|nr:SAM-dependent methyltransferase [Spirochaetales bacterium]